VTPRLLLVSLGLGLLVAAGGEASARSPQEGRPVTLGSTELSALRVPAAAAATWCGTATTQDVTPNVVAGHPVHWLYVMPSDGPDRLSTYASVMQTDAEAIDAWWRREDPTRTPRNDLRRLPCGTQLDISSVRLQQTGLELDSDFNFGDVLDGIEAAGFGSTLTKYLVYYDGPLTPTEEGEVCGRGGSLPSGLGLAVVYVRACLGVSTAAVAAHELLHTLDAVPFGAPNECDGHVCDTDDDLMYPFLDDDALEERSLDPGRDDYYGHAGTQTDVQDADWLVRLNEQAGLRLTVSGPGSVAADVPGLRCAQTCTTTWNSGTRVRLAATPSRSAKLVRWSGGCTGAGACSLAVTPGRTVTALFAPRSYRLTVGVAGKGSVRSSARGISCGKRCAASFSSHVPLRLTATPAKGWRLRSWAGACRGRKLTCSLPMSTATSARAVFARAPSR
jgi:Divergent InlB B-repeat domain